MSVFRFTKVCSQQAGRQESVCVTPCEPDGRSRPDSVAPRPVFLLLQHACVQFQFINHVSRRSLAHHGVKQGTACLPCVRIQTQQNGVPLPSALIRDRSCLSVQKTTKTVLHRIRGTTQQQPCSFCVGHHQPDQADEVCLEAQRTGGVRRQAVPS